MERLFAPEWALFRVSKRRFGVLPAQLAVGWRRQSAKWEAIGRRASSFPVPKNTQPCFSRNPRADRTLFVSFSSFVSSFIILIRRASTPHGCICFLFVPHKLCGQNGSCGTNESLDVEPNNCFFWVKENRHIRNR